MNVLGRNLVSSLCQHFKESLSIIERCTFHTASAVQSSHKYKGTYRYTPILIAQEEIKNNPLKALKAHRTGGRGPDGRIWNHRRAGGHAKRIRVVDSTMDDLDGEPRHERVLFVRYDPCRSAHIAAVAGGKRKRYILASENMKAGDLITTSTVIPEVTVKPKEGNSYALGALPLGTLIHNIEKFPGKGGSVAQAAGSSAQLIRKLGDQCIIKMPSKREMTVSSQCMATVGRVSNLERVSIPIGSAWRKRWLGIRPRSGWKQKKTGYHGRKIRPIKPNITYDKPKSSEQEIYRFTI